MVGHLFHNYSTQIYKLTVVHGHVDGLSIISGLPDFIGPFFMNINLKVNKSSFEVTAGNKI